MDDYPNSSETLEPYVVEKPEERKAIEEKEQTKVSSSIGVIKDVLEWLDEQADSYRGVDFVEGVNIASKAEDVKSAVLLGKAMRTQFLGKSEEFRAHFAKHLEKMANEA